MSLKTREFLDPPSPLNMYYIGIVQPVLVVEMT